MSAAQKRAAAEAHNARHIEAQAYAEDRVRFPPKRRKGFSPQVLAMIAMAATYTA